jgi:predicted DNA repair protein MutK
LAWLVNTLASAIIGLAVGALAVAIVTRVQAARQHGAPAAPH